MDFRWIMIINFPDSRGFYNLVESLPFVLLNFFLCREVAKSPAVAGLSLTLFGVGRIAYAKAYAVDGPKARGSGFIVGMVASSLMIGVPIVQVVRSFIK